MPEGMMISLEPPAERFDEAMLIWRVMAGRARAFL
jgi:hypothetical protein